ncbi:sigma-70 family RNA polymerase sigma factor [Pseudomonas putida CSV86]|uniref:RNA polymerase subunit sigma n=2 Tax=Pseudomonas TaxID=286 RepID=A0A177SRH0_PSEPU|nr:MULTISPECIES: sigma-70 family RNA polymerase sigma factor [Pseudomonas]NNJ18381.1 sigma-70 family RNA polymerase sigma factor [Pseudomonas bharatica CSV86]OAI93565.1 RNA polymerase subunit sigma [Pseudomonas putida]
MSSPAQTLYVKHSPWLLLFLRRRLGNGWDAADLLHDTFLRVLRRPLEFDNQTGERSYLATIAKGLCIDHWRRAQLERAWRESLVARPEAVQPSAEHTALLIETLAEVDAMLMRLPAKVREAFLMAQVEGITYGVIAERLEVSERMVKKYMAQAFLHCAVLEAELDGVLVE